MTCQVTGAVLWAWWQRERQVIVQHTSDLPTQQAHWQELDWLLLALSDLDRLALRLETFRQRPQVTLQRSLDELSTLWQRRLHEQVPLQYLLGIVHWRDFTLAVRPGVLIPRPETELLIDLAQAAAQKWQVPNLVAQQWADLGTGSGAIAIGLARHFPQAIIHAVDCSAAALDIAKLNAEQLQVADQICFYQGAWLEPLQALAIPLDGIVSNPPYIPTDLIMTLQPDVAHHEPRLALDGGEDGLEAIRTIIHQAPQYLRPGGVLLLEMMMGQGNAVLDLLQQDDRYENRQLHSDLAGIERFAEAYTKGETNRDCLAGNNLYLSDSE